MRRGSLITARDLWKQTGACGHVPWVEFVRMARVLTLVFFEIREGKEMEKP
jgi:hypothetical protein